MVEEFAQLDPLQSALYNVSYSRLEELAHVVDVDVVFRLDLGNFLLRLLVTHD